MRLDVFKDDLDCDGASNNFGHVNEGGSLPDPPDVHDVIDTYSERAVLHINVKISCISDVTVANSLVTGIKLKKSQII